MNIILLSGGSGKRLWPLSNDVRSKQFVQLLADKENGHESMVKRVYRQIQAANLDANIVVATSASQKDSIKIQLSHKVDIVVEPERRNTFPAIVLATSYLLTEKKIDPNETVIVLPVDPYVDLEYFETFKKMEQAVQSDQSDIVLMGLQPTYPSSKYGYAVVDEKDRSRIVGFKEKPTETVAEEMIQQGALWNAGVFAFKLGYLQKITQKYLPDCGYPYVLEHYSSLKKDSFDYEVVEKAESLSIVTYQGQWKDIGTWNTLTEVMSETSIGDVTVGEECQNTHVINELSIPIVVLGAKDLVIAASPDGILVSDKQKSSYIKPYVEKLGDRPMYEESIWGDYKVLDYSQYENERKSLTKQIMVKKGRYIDYMLHSLRDEVWTIVDGKGYITIDGITSVARNGDVFNLRAGDKHGFRAITDVHMIEVQVGQELSEDDAQVFDWPSV